MTKELVENLPVEDFKKALQSLPISCVDIVVRNNKNKVLLMKRKEKPAEGEWWFPGGRIFKNEKIIDTIARKLKDEVGLNEYCYPEQIGTFETIFDDGPFEQQSHTINTTYLVDLIDISKMQTEVSINEKYSSDYRWVDGNEDFISKYVKDIISIVNEEY